MRHKLIISHRQQLVATHFIIEERYPKNIRSDIKIKNECAQILDLEQVMLTVISIEEAETYQSGPMP